VNDTSISEKYYIRINVTLKPEHIDFLKRIDQDNYSRAARIVIDRYIKQTRFFNFEKYLPVFAVGFAFIIIGSILQNFYVSLTSILTGAFMMLYSGWMYSKNKLKYNLGET